MLFKRQRPVEEVAVGAVFRRLCAGEVVETARVLSISRDPAGIPHVRFSIHYDRAEAADDLRTLALATFASLFRERVGA